MTFAEWTRVPLVPVTFRVEAPAFDCFFVVTVNTDVPDCVTEGGLNVAVANFGRPSTDRVTVPVKPSVGAIVTVYVVLAGRPIVLVAGATATVKSPALVTTSVTLTECATGPLVPLMVRGYVPAGVEPVVVTLSVVVPDVGTDAGLKDAVAPDGRPLTVKSTVPVNPVPAVTVAV